MRPAMESLRDEIKELLDAPVRLTEFGRTNWLEGAGAIDRVAEAMDSETFHLEFRLLVFALDEGKRAAILRLAREIEQLRDN
jgi:hypothetical protein